jgi:hypothetical protein
MPWTDKHLVWLKKTSDTLTTIDGKSVEMWKFCHRNDPAVLSAWAKHFRNHYCLDGEIDNLRKGTRYSRADYLNKIKFPDPSTPPGPSIRAGDFAEILVADYLEFLLGYWVPRTRYGNKAIRNESTKGCDLLGFKIFRDGYESNDDTLALFEAKARFSGRKSRSRLQDAVNGSAKDHVRRGESLNAIKQRLLDKQDSKDASKIERFQDLEGRPYKEQYWAAAVFSTSAFSVDTECKTDTSKHPHSKELMLLVICGDDMMKLVHSLYRRAADEA